MMFRLILLCGLAGAVALAVLPVSAPPVAGSRAPTGAEPAATQAAAESPPVVMRPPVAMPRPATTAPPLVASGPPAQSTSPQVPIAYLMPGQSADKYAALVVRMVGEADSDGNGLDAADIDIDRAKQVRSARERAEIVRGALAGDLDLDGRLTIEELSRAVSRARFSRDQTARVRAQIEAMLLADRDSDGTLTLAEMIAAAGMAKSGPGNELRDILHDFLRAVVAADPDAAGRVSPDEVARVAAGWFKAADLDGDGKIDFAEHLLLRKAAAGGTGERANDGEAPAETCTLPQPAAGDLIVDYRIEGGSALSSVTVAGENVATSTTTVTIESGSQPIYLILVSEGALIWKLDGATGRIGRAVVVSMAASSDGGPGSGVIGLAADHVTFVPETECRNLRPRLARAGRPVLADLLGRAPDAAFGTSEVESARLPSGEILGGTIVIGRKRLPPPGFDGDMWNRGNSFSLEGLVTFDPAEVVGPRPAEPYEILPDWAGLAQLLGAGSIERLDDAGAFRIVAPIAHYPAGIHASNASRLILAAGVPVPAGDPGGACVVSEETGRPIDAGRGRCQ